MTGATRRRARQFLPSWRNFVRRKRHGTQIALPVANMKQLALLVAGLFLHISVIAGATRESMAPPFGLSWVESRSQISQLIDQAHLRLVKKDTAEDRESWTVEGFDQPGLSAVVFYFIGDALDEVELQYSDPDWSLGQYGELMEKVKEELDFKYGRGEMLARERGPAKDVSQTLVGYRWQQPDQALDLVFYAAERDPLAFRLLSMHYKLAHR